MDEIQTWAQGYFVDHPRYANMSKAWREDMQRQEAFLVRPGATDNAICEASSPENAQWIASRLNLAAKLEAEQGDFSWALLQMKAGKWVTLDGCAIDRFNWRVTIRDGMFWEAWDQFNKYRKEGPYTDRFSGADLQSNKWRLYEGEKA